MRLFRIRLFLPAGRNLSGVRAFVRLLGLVVSIAVLLLGFVPILFDGRRRALPDLLSGTVVVHDHRAAAAS